ncbi:fungal-specific transcription factor domain-containing protein [Scleroderma citrinum]
MPPVTKSKHKVGRRDEEFSFDGGHAREIEQKRNNGQISCAECRRLKIKCDKQIPCQSCQRRGCAALCPNGSLATGQGTRFVLAATEHLHRRIAKMSERIRQLEDALGELHAKGSTEPHPLLRPDLVGANRQDEGGPLPPDDPVFVDNPSELPEAFGTLSITDSSDTPRFFGPTAGSHIDHNSSQDDGSATDSVRDSKSPELPHEIEIFSQAFPFNPTNSGPTVRKVIETYLPTWDRGAYLTETYLEQAGWLFRGVSREQIMDELLPVYYFEGIIRIPTEDTNPHHLALVFLIFAIGALVDLRQAPGNAEAEHYHHVARAAICLQSVMEKPSLETIQALHLLSIYNALSGNELSGKETSMETTWSLVSLAAHLSHTVYRDSARWELSPEKVQRRRVVFWDLCVADYWHSLDTGRPPIFNLAYVNCKLPRSSSANDKGDIDKQAAYESWAMRFTSECLSEVIARTLTTDSPSYSTIMELDRKVNDFSIPEPVADFVAAVSGAMPAKPQDREIGIAESMGRFVMSNAREVILLYIHRSYFAQVVMENAVDPLKSAYTHSFLAAYRASTTILHTLKAQFNQHGNLTARFWPVWTYSLTAGVVFGTIVTRCPRSPMAAGAMKELHDACTLLSKGAVYSRRAQRALPILTRLREKAHNVLILAQNDMPYELRQQWTVENDGDTDELAIFAGRTKFVSVKRTTTDSASEGSTKQTSPMPDLQQQQQSTDQTIVQSCGPGSSGAAWTRGPTIDATQPQVMTLWDPAHYPMTASQSTLTQLPPLTRPPAPPQAQAQGPPIPGPSTRQWLTDTSDPYQLANLADSSTHSHPQVYHPHTQRYDQPPHLPPASSTVPTYYNLGSAGAHQHQNLHQHPPTSLRQHHPPTHQLPPIALAPPELAQLGLVAQESRLDQRWTAFMQESGYFEGFQYKP